MQYRKFGADSWKISALGFGTAGLPLDDGEAVNLLEQALAAGINYIEIRYNDNRYIEAEERIFRLIGEALALAYPDRARVTVNLPAREYTTMRDVAAYLQHQSVLLGSRVDYLQFGGLNRDTWPLLKESGLLAGAARALERGLVRGVGFSFRDQFMYLRPVIEGFDAWSFCRFQYSYMDADHLPGTPALSLAAEKGLAVIAGGVLKQGRLVDRIPALVAAIWEDNDPAGQALRWALNRPQVCSAVADIQTLEHLAHDVAIVEKALPDHLSVEEAVRISKARDAYRTLKVVNCTGCRACMPCSRGIDVPRIFELYNEGVMYSAPEMAATLYRKEQHDISACDSCGECSRRCGRSIDIPARLKEALDYIKKYL